jgi:hypothetical protein
VLRSIIGPLACFLHARDVVNTRGEILRVEGVLCAMTTVREGCQGAAVPDWIFGEGRNFLICVWRWMHDVLSAVLYLAAVGLRVVLNEWVWQTRYMWSDC